MDTASEIIREISHVIDYDLNLIDNKGTILASTDEKRLGTYHEAAQKLVKEGLSELIIQYDNQYEGCRKGVNLPIYFASKLVGVVGITGDPSETIHYGQVIKKMTEMILYKNYIGAQQGADQQSILLLLNDLIHGNFDLFYHDVENRLKQHNLKTQGPFTAMVLRYSPASLDQSNSDLFNAKQTIIRQGILDFLTKKGILAAFSHDQFIAVSNHTMEQLIELMTQKIDEMEGRFNISLLCSIGNTYEDYTGLQKSYSEAIATIQYYDSRNSGIMVFSTIILDFTLSQMPEIYKQNLQQQVFKNCTKEEIKEYSSFIRTYLKCNGSIHEISEAYYIHKNTTQYKIKKIQKKTGLDMRRNQDLFLLYMAACYA
jgi:carbohydrate diacid regulator